MSRVFLHGFTQSPDSWRSVRDEGDHCPWLPGHGSSLEVAGFEATCESIARSLGGSTHLVGYSLGGRLALGVALHAAAKIEHLTLLGSHPGISDRDERAERAERDSTLAGELRSRGLEWFIGQWEEHSMWSTQAKLPKSVLLEQRRTRTSHTAEGLARVLERLGPGRMPNFWPRLGELQCPVDLVVGELDEKYREICARMAERLQKARVTIFTGVGHNVVLEAPSRLRSLLAGEVLP